MVDTQRQDAADSSNLHEGHCLYMGSTLQNNTEEVQCRENRQMVQVNLMAEPCYCGVCASVSLDGLCPYVMKKVTDL